MSMQRVVLAALLSAAISTPAGAATRELTLAQAVDLAFKSDPTLAEAKIQRDRSKWVTLRAQLDRFSLKIDGSIQEIWQKSNIGGPTIFDNNCSTPNPFAPGSTINLPFGQDQCNQVPGSMFTSMPDPVQSPQQGIGTFNLQAQLNVPIFAGFRVQSNVDRAKRLEDASIVGIRQARKDVALAVMRSYWSVRRLDLLVEVQRRSIQRLKEAEMVTDGRVKAGLAPPIDRNRATLRRLQTEASIADLQGQSKESGQQLAVALGVTDDLVLLDNPNVPETPPPSVDELIAEAKGFRPEIATARYQAAAGHQAVRMAMSNFYPQLSGFGFFQFTNNAFSFVTGTRSASDQPNPFQDIAGNLTVGLNLSMNFFDTLNTWTGTKDALFEEARLQEEIRRFARIVDSDVRTAYARLVHLYQRRAPLIAALEIATDNLKILEARYKNGDALVIEYLDGQNDLITAEQQVVDVTAQLQQAWLELEAALGRVVGVNG
jgi:outer membrane protein TolC